MSREQICIWSNISWLLLWSPFGPQLSMKALATGLYTASKGIPTTLGSFAVHRRQALQA